MQKQHAAQLNALQSELRETQKAFGEQLVKSHEQKINLINQHSVELRQADARTEAVRGGDAGGPGGLHGLHGPEAERTDGAHDGPPEKC